MGGHDVQHLGGLYPNQVIIVLQQGLQALQAACGDRSAFEPSAGPKGNQLEVDA